MKSVLKAAILACNAESRHSNVRDQLLTAATLLGIEEDYEPAFEPNFVLIDEDDDPCLAGPLLFSK